MDSFNSLKAEIHALRTKIGVIFGILGAIFTIIIGYSVTTSYSVENIFPLLQTIYNLPESLNGSFSPVLISPINTSVVESFSSLLVASFVMLGIEYFWLYLELHALNSTVCPPRALVRHMEDVQDRQKIEQLILSDIKITTSQLSLDFKFYSAVSRGYDFFLLILLAILFIGYLAIMSFGQTPILVTFIIPVLGGAMAFCEVVLLGIFLKVLYHSKNEKRKLDFVNDYPLKKYLKIFFISVWLYFSIVFIFTFPSVISRISIIVATVAVILVPYIIKKFKTE